ncbi:MAG TPA: ATP-binding protein [Vicinamibacterales bacterium]|nr:ATP-binding protein [Vicinamibacterales bacterium]
MYQAALDALRDTVGVSRSSILLFGPDGVMRFAAWRGLSAEYRAAVEGHSPWRPETPDPAPIAVPDVARDPSLARHLPIIQREGIASMLFVPLVARGRVIGKFMCYAAEPRDFSPQEIALAVGIAQQVAFALSRSATEMECARLTAQAEFLADLTAALNRTLDYGEMLAVLTQLSVPRIGDLCILHMRGDDGAVRVRAVAHRDPVQADGVQGMLRDVAVREDGGPGVGEVIRTGETRVFRQVEPADLAGNALDEASDSFLRELRLRAGMIVPLRTSSAVAGAISFVATAASGRTYCEADLALAEEVAGRAAIAIENALLYRFAQEANRQKDEFLANLSHELRTPLNSVLGWARMLESGRLSPERAAQAVTTIRRNAETQARLIADILDVARIVSGKLQLALEDDADVSRIVASAVESLEAEAQRKGVTLATWIEPGLVATVDSARLQQVVWNLVSNAIKFTPASGRVEIALRYEDRGLTLQVRDTGRGIDPAFLPHLFQRFRQAESSATRAHAGLGLGLAIARHLTELHGGSIRAESEGLGLGSTFVVRLPGALAATTQASDAARGDRDVHRLDGSRVLVVDDDPDARQLLAVMLGDAGAAVATAGSLDEAMAYLEREPCDLLVADIAMPGGDGFELLHRVRAAGAAADRLPAIAVTAHARDDDRRRALLAGFQGHLPKPVDQDALLEMTASALERRSARITGC